MMGHSHAMSGLAVGAALLPAAPVTGTTMQVAWVAAWGGFALLPDLDAGGWSMDGPIPKGHGSTVARMWGPITITLSELVGKVARGHRNGTHDAIAAPLAFGALTVLSTLHPWTGLVMLAFAIGLALHACHLFIPGGTERTVVGNLALSFGGAWWLTDHGQAGVPWLPIAVAGGVLVHIVGDLVTVGGVPVPFTWLDGKATRVALGLFRTGKRFERWAVAPLLVASALALIYMNTGLADFGQTLTNALEATE